MANIFAIEFPTYLPAMRIITSITQAKPAVVTTSFAHGYITGEIVRISVPYEHGMYTWGMEQIDSKKGTILVLNSTQFSIDIDSTLFDPFVTPAPPINQRSYVAPIGEVNSTLRAATRNVL